MRAAEPQCLSLSSTVNLFLEKEQISQGQTELSEAQRAQHEFDAEVVDQKAKIAALEEKLYSGEVKLPRELKALQDDVEAHQRGMEIIVRHAAADSSAADA